MKKVLGLLLVLGVIFYWTETGYAVEEGQDLGETGTSEEEVLDNSTTTPEEVVDIDGEAEDFLEVPEKKSTFSTTKNKKISIKKFYIEITDGNSSSKSVSLPRTDYRISFISPSDNKEVLLYEGVTNDNGEISNLPDKVLPASVEGIRIRFSLGEKSRGYVQKSNRKPYSFVFSLGFKNATQLSYTATKVKFGSPTDQDTYFYNYQAARLNYYFQNSVKEYSEAVNLARSTFYRMSKFTIKPINIHFEKGVRVDVGNGFSGKGYDQSGVPTISIGDKKLKNKFTETYLKMNVMHEWSHWNMAQITKLPGREKYIDHNSYNSNPQVSYKEGWAEFVTALYWKNYNVHSLDSIVQNDNLNGRNRLFGKSTNNTVKYVLLDLADLPAVDEEFVVSQRYLENGLTENQIQKTNLGFLHHVMTVSKATTLQEFLMYFKANYIHSTSDLKKFNKALAINGVNTANGAFTLDDNSNQVVYNVEKFDITNAEMGDSEDPNDLEEVEEE